MAIHVGVLLTRLFVPTFSSWLRQYVLTINGYAKPDQKLLNHVASQKNTAMEAMCPWLCSVYAKNLISCYLRKFFSVFVFKEIKWLVTLEKVVTLFWCSQYSALLDLLKHFAPVNLFLPCSTSTTKHAPIHLLIHKYPTHVLI